MRFFKRKKEKVKKWTKDYCLYCQKEMRKWRTSDLGCVSMCVNPDCNENGLVYKSIQNINDIKMNLNIKI